MVKLVNRAKMTIASGGAGDITLGTAVDGYQTFADAGVSDTDVVRYTIEDGDDWEIGTGVYTASGTTLARTPTESSNSGNAITATTDSVVFVTAAAADLGPTVHSTIDDLIAQTGMTVGDTALVTGTNRLYMYTTSGWFLVATMTNTSPSAITGAAANYALATDGTATVITLASTDPEGFPITFSHTVSTGSLGSTATVTQGTGANANVFTVTPSSNSDHVGSFSLTFSASDGNSVSQAISAFSLAFGPDLTNASYDNLSFHLELQGTKPTGLAFNSDGTKMFTTDSGIDRVFQYSLTNPFSLASGNVTYDDLYFYLGGEDASPMGLKFSPDGTKMFMVGATSGGVYQYSLTNPFSLASGNVTYDGLSFSTGPQDSSSYGIEFSYDGTKMFIMGTVTESVFQYSLATGFSLASGNVTYDNISFSTGATPIAMSFNSSGTKFFVARYDTKRVYQYSLTNPFSLASGNVTYDNLDFYTGSEEIGSLQDIIFSPDGTKMFTVGGRSDSVFQYDVSL